MSFEQALQTNDPSFDNILEIMKAGRQNEQEIESARNFLKVVNLVVDYYTSREDNELKIPVVYFPICNNNSQELCEEFVSLKFGYFMNEEWRTEKCNILRSTINRGIVLTSNERTQMMRQRAINHFKFVQKLFPIIENNTSKSDRNENTFLYSESLHETFLRYKQAQRHSNNQYANKYWYLSGAINGNYQKTDGEPLALISGSPKDLHNYIIKNAGERKINNIVVFPCKNPDGDYSEFCKKIFQQAYLNRFVKADSGLRNVFFFRFSKKPFRLRRLYDIKKYFFDNVSNDIDFITFNYEEAALLFNQQNSNIRYLTINSEDEVQQEFEHSFDAVIAELEDKVFRCNEAAICIFPEMADTIIPTLSSESETEKTLLQPIFRINQELWDKKTSTLLSHFLNGKRVCVVLANNIDPELILQFNHWLHITYCVSKVEFATFKDLRGYLDNGIYKNRISCERILILSFRNDYTERIFHKYPNSFDPICINSDQKALVIQNHFIIGQYYDKGWNGYNKSIKKILYSDFRSQKMRPSLKELRELHRQALNDLNDEVNDQNARNTQQLFITIEYADSSQRSFIRNEWMLYCNHNNELSIVPLSDLADIYSASAEGLSIQPMSPLVNFVYDQFVEVEREKDINSEKIFKELPVYGLTEDEKQSSLQLWKILLKKRIQEFSPERVYDEIMKDGQKVEYDAFLKWPNENFGLPRANKMQEFLIKDYLKIGGPYLNIVRRIKERKRDKRETINASIRLFLANALLSNNSSSVYESTNEETRNLLGIESESEVEKIISSVKRQITLEPIKTISI